MRDHVHEEMMINQWHWGEYHKTHQDAWACLRVDKLDIFLFGETMSLWFSPKAMGIQINQPLIETDINRYTGRCQTLQFFTGNIKWSFQLELSAPYFRQTHFFKGSIYFCSLCVGVDWGMDP